MIFLSRSGYCSDVSLRAVFIGWVFIALLCVQEDPNDRPHMSSVALMLGSKWVVLPKPSSPPFSVGKSFMHDQSSTTQVRHIRAKYGDYFGITIAGYPGFNLALFLFSLDLFCHYHD